MDIETANDQRVGRKTRYAGHQAWQIRSIRAFPAIGASEGEACVEDRILIEDVRHATRNLLIEDVNVTIAVAACRSLNVGWRYDLALVLTVADEGCVALVEGLIDANVKLIIVDRVRWLRRIVIGEGATGNVWLRERTKNAFGEGR